MIAFVLRHRVSLMLALLLLAGAVAAQSAAGCGRASFRSPTLSSRDACPQGAQALALWLEQLGYRVDRIEGTVSSPDDSVDLLFVLRPTRPFAPTDTRATLDWVRRGGVLVYVPSPFPIGRQPPALPGDGLADQLDLAARFGPATEQATASFPFFTAPPATRFAVKSPVGLELRTETWVPLVTVRDRVFAATRELERGRVYAVASEVLLSNGGIGEQDNFAFVLNVLARHPDVQTIAFDEYHHGVVSPPSLAAVMRSSPWGWAVVYGTLLTFGFLLWGGRRFGPALVPERTPHRSGGEYVAAFAGLLQRARAAGWVQTQYAQLVRRRLGRTLGVRADLPAADLARLVSERWPIEPASLADPLAALEGPPIGERGLLARVRALEHTLRLLGGREN